MKVAKKLQAKGALKRLYINGLRDFLSGKSCRKTCRKSFFRETRSFRRIQKCRKSTKNIAKTAQIRRFERFLLELLGRFELPTSSLPTSDRHYQVVLTLPNKSPKNLIFQWIAGFRSTNESQRITLKTMFPNPIFTPFVPKLFPKWNYP